MQGVGSLLGSAMHQLYNAISAALLGIVLTLGVDILLLDTGILLGWFAVICALVGFVALVVMIMAEIRNIDKVK